MVEETPSITSLASQLTFRQGSAKSSPPHSSSSLPKLTEGEKNL